jgi:hypothetical protein
MKVTVLHFHPYVKDLFTTSDLSSPITYILRPASNRIEVIALADFHEG